MEFQNSITERAMGSVKQKWLKELSENTQWLEAETQKEIFDFLNERESLCTAEFILRRQIQAMFPALMEKAAALAGVDYADLSKSGNIPWAAELVEALSGVLASEKFPGVSGLNLDRRQWKKVLLGEAFCNRATAIKLIFALKMDEVTAAKFLISNGKNPFSTRNPSDYLYEFCLKGNFSCDTATALLHDFEARRKDSSDDAAQEEMEFATIQLENETERILGNVKITAQDKQKRIVDYMVAHGNEFVRKVERKERRAEYPSGFSKQNNMKLKIFLRYLTELYPSFSQFKEVNEFDSYLFSRAVQTNKDGSPKTPEQLMRAMREEQGIHLFETAELEEIGLPTGNERNEQGQRQLREKQRYDAIPFNNYILLPFKNLSKTLRSNLRAEKYPNNAQDVERSTILFLAYFFICYCQTHKDELENLAAKLDAEIAREDNPQKNNLLYALKAVVCNVEDLPYVENLPELYVDSLNALLDSFKCSPFYAPFVIDRFILFCLLTLRRPKDAEDFPKYLMNLLIEQSYYFSKKILEGKDNVEKNEIPARRDSPG